MMTAASVKAIELGLKTATRRVLDPQPELLKDFRGQGHDSLRVTVKRGKTKKSALVPYPIHDLEQMSILQDISPYCCERLWVKQRWRVFRALNTSELEEKKRFQLLIQYGADLPTDRWRDCDQESFIRYAHDGDWKNQMFMPRWASRLDLWVLSVRLEQLGEMTEKDCAAEGIKKDYYDQVAAFGQGCLASVEAKTWSSRTPLENFRWFWNIVNEDRGHAWNDALWVWVIKFQPIKENVCPNVQSRPTT